MTWDADLRMHGQQWRHHSFKGKKWEQIKARERQQYHLNAYRVLLTRARQGMIIFVPPGDAADPTREPGFYDETFECLADGDSGGVTAPDSGPETQNGGPGANARTLRCTACEALTAGRIAPRASIHNHLYSNDLPIPE
jgi:hypothetical protein